MPFSYQEQNSGDKLLSLMVWVYQFQSDLTIQPYFLLVHNMNEAFTFFVDLNLV